MSKLYKYSFILILTTTLFCGTGLNAEVIKTDQSIVTGYISDKNRVTLTKKNIPVKLIPIPNKKDKAYLKKVSVSIRKKVINFLGDPRTVYDFEAARAYGRILLLDISPRGEDDGNLHVVYDLKRGVVVGYFNWYEQG